LSSPVEGEDLNENRQKLATTRVEVDLFATARKEKPMPPEFYITCPKCGHRYNVHKMIYDEGEDFSMFCPVCTARYPRKEGKIDAANFDIKK
jgi:transcription elongation factor Elf1